MKPIKIIIFFVLVFSFSFTLTAQGKRVALVVGNGAYESNPLNNPPNDADDIGKALEEADFDVTIIKDADLASFERAIDNFVRGLRGAETALFYYAGHGVQVDGLNYLIPTSPRIDDVHSVRARAISVDAIIGRVETSGVKTSLIFLDSCRDNPFPGASRSGTRGLSVVATPKTSNSLIAYATAPGDVAADGKGRNGVFSGAVLNHLRTPGLELSEMMREVRAEVASVTKNKQNPRVDDGMKEPFYFLDPDVVAARAKAESDKANKALQEIEKEIADREAAIKKAKNAREKELLEIEQQTQVALQKTKQLEAENLKKEAERREEEALLAKRLEEQKEKDLLKARQEQEHLTSLALQKREELEKLNSSFKSEDPQILMDTIISLKKSIKEIEDEHAKILESSLEQIEQEYNQLLTSSSNKEPWESNSEYKDRLGLERIKLEMDKEQSKKNKISYINNQSKTLTAEMREKLKETVTNLEAQRWTFSGSNVKIKIGEWDANTKIWPFYISGGNENFAIIDKLIVANLSETKNLKEDYEFIIKSIKTEALTSTITWGIKHDIDNEQFVISHYGTNIKNIIDNKIIASDSKEGIMGFVSDFNKARVVGKYGSIRVNTKNPEAIIFINNDSVGMGSWSGSLEVGKYSVSAKNNNPLIVYPKKNVKVKENKEKSINLKEKYLKLNTSSYMVGISGLKNLFLGIDLGIGKNYIGFGFEVGNEDFMLLDQNIEKLSVLDFSGNYQRRFSKYMLGFDPFIEFGIGKTIIDVLDKEIEVYKDSNIVENVFESFYFNLGGGINYTISLGKGDIVTAIRFFAKGLYNFYFSEYDGSSYFIDNSSGESKKNYVEEIKLDNVKIILGASLLLPEL